MNVLAWFTGAKTFLTWGTIGAMTTVADVQTVRLATGRIATEMLAECVEEDAAASLNCIY